MVSNEFLAEMRLTGDALADNVIKEVFESGKIDGHKFFKDLSRDQLNELEYSSVVKDYFEKTASVPEGVDVERLDRGVRLFALYGMEISMILLCKALPECYACGKGAKVLYETGKFTVKNNDIKPFQKRLIETAQFVVHVLSPKGFHSQGLALRTIQKVRLMHAASRFFLQKKEWDVDELGLPVNQQDMCGTLMAFSVLIIDGLKKLEIELSEKEIEDYLYVWQIAGELLGLHSKLLPHNYAYGKMLGECIFEDQVLGTQEGEELTESVLLFMKSYLPFSSVNKLPEVIVDFFVGHKIAGVIGVNIPDNNYYVIYPYLLKYWGRVKSRVLKKLFIVQYAVSGFNLMILKIMIKYMYPGGDKYLVGS